uniref:Pachytene checkpoint protein 2 homolog n=1 Tax=Saccoglossus kowalevskii TaxID=10224 RepID=A0ABM0H0R7_SACKO|nr:PREDICTED: pachytene checkpoint protein 2 homolog [Saccoglossus kowalevskii]
MEVGDLENALPDYVEPSVHVEICQNPCSTLTAAIIKEHVMQLLHQHRTAYGDFILTEFDDPILIKHVKSVAICDTDLSKLGKQAIDLCHTQLDLHVFQLQEDGAASEELDDDNLSAASHWILPAVEFHGMWENLIFDSSVKEDLLYSYGQLIEINSHSLFSKWFSESGKLVMKMFQKIQEFIDNQDALICVLIDEVESLTAARKSSMSGAEPSDAIRVVNALLTQIDQIKKHPNVIILTTSNVTGAIDLAFVDRADIKQYIGHPSPAAVFKIYHSCLCELMRKRIIQPLQQLLDLRALEVMEFKENDATKLSMRLWEIANQSHGLSGRTLRKLPFLAHALYIQTRTVSLKDYLAALSEVVKRQFEERGHLESS